MWRGSKLRRVVGQMLGCGFVRRLNVGAQGSANAESDAQGNGPLLYGLDAHHAPARGCNFAASSRKSVHNLRRFVMIPVQILDFEHAFYRVEWLIPFQGAAVRDYTYCDDDYLRRVLIPWLRNNKAEWQAQFVK
jgi:hypothetical protein